MMPHTKLTSYLAKNHSEIVIENLNVSGMMKNHCLAGAIADSGFHEFRRQLEYKASWYGSKVVLIDKFYPSSQLCSGCGRQPMPLKLRQYDCSSCGLSLERDLNAAIISELFRNCGCRGSLWTGSAWGPEETGIKHQVGYVQLCLSLE